MRIKYVPNPPANLTDEEQAIVDRVKARRGKLGLVPLDLALLHSPNVTDGWNSFLGAIRTRTSLRDSVREIAICRPGIINRAWFEVNAHIPMLLHTPGFTEGKLNVVKTLYPAEQGPLDDQEWAVLLYADEMTRAVKVSDSAFERLRRAKFSEKEIVEITATVAAYNAASRFLVALEIGEQYARQPDWAEPESASKASSKI